MSTMCETCGQLVVNTPCDASSRILLVSYNGSENASENANGEPCESIEESHIEQEEACISVENDGFAPTLRSLIEKLPLSVRARLTAKLAHLNIDKSIDSPAVRGVVEFAVQAYDKKRASARESSAKRRLQAKNLFFKQ